MDRKSTLFGLLLGAAAFIGALLALMVTPGARAAMTFTDPAGDAGVAAPDVTTIDVSNAGGTITMIVHATGVATDSSGGYTEIEGVFNADQNVATGDEAGIDYFFRFASDSGDQWTEAYEWTGGEEGFTESSVLPEVSSSGNTHTFTFSADELGIGSGFDFFVIAIGENAAGWSSDVAPDMTGDTFNSYTYTLTTEPVTPVTTTGTLTTEPVTATTEAQQEVTGLVGLTGDGSIFVRGDDGFWHYIDSATFVALGYDWNTVQWFGELPGSIGDPVAHVTPAAPATTPVPRAPESVAVVVPVIGKGFTRPGTVLAGRKVVVSFPVTDADTGATVTAVTMMSSNPKIGNTIIKHVETFVGGYATVTLKVPKTATGKSLKVALTVKSGDQSASKTATFKIH